MEALGRCWCLKTLAFSIPFNLCNNIFFLEFNMLLFMLVISEVIIVLCMMVISEVMIVFIMVVILES